VTTPKFPPPPRKAQNSSGVLRRARPHQLRVGRHHVGADEVVHHHAELPRQPAKAAAQREAGDAGVRDHPAGDRKAVALRGGIELAPRQAGAGECAAPIGIDLELLHAGHVDDETVVAHRPAGKAVTAGADRHAQAGGPPERHRRGHVGGALTPHDQRRTPIDHAVPDAARGVVLRIVGRDEGSADESTQARDVGDEAHENLLRGGFTSVGRALSGSPRGP
jgi:hypothetical protein